MIKVSVIVPVYNVDRYLGKCLDHLLEQTLTDIEIICVNDGSTDRSKEILDEYERKDSRIKIVEQKNQGLSSARNTGVKHAYGEYIHFMDSDDFIELNALECLFKRAKRDDLDILFFNAVVFFEDEEIKLQHSSYGSYYKRNGSYNRVTTGPALLAEMVSNNDWKPSVCLQFINRNFYQTSELSFYEGIVHEDTLFSFLAVLQAQKVAYEEVSFFHRRIRGDSLVTMEKTASHFNGLFISYIEMRKFCVDNRDMMADAFNAAAELIFIIYKTALKIYCGLSSQERSNLKSLYVDSDVISSFLILDHHANDIFKSQKLKRDVDYLKKEIAQIRSSRSFKLAQFIGKLYRMGR